MNKLCYRKVFNKSRGMIMVVGELVALCAGLGSAGSALGADIIADPSAANHNRPQVESTANGRPLVNIVAPNVHGLSHNKYQQFNVGSGGAVLNNSGAISNTNTAGYVQGNPNLGSNSANIILNEVTHQNPSYLNGALEIAGKPAELIIANPSGISCNGCGFINTNKLTLTTGTPVFGGSGSLDAFRVIGGSVQFTGAGINANNLD
jgi:filamentous hemagglutinin